MVKATFGDVVDAANELSLDEQQSLLEILRRRIADLARRELVRDVEEARDEFRSGGARPASVDDLMNEVGS